MPYFFFSVIVESLKGRPGAVVRAVSLSHQVVGSKQPLRRFCEGKACLGLSLPQTPLMWEPPALGLPPFCNRRITESLKFQDFIHDTLSQSETNS